ncbi:ArnT family glycosyltransferase [Streptacidiphilus jiangxiensis]|uniref:4-amino-4-deoxy-L-arabinose transferase n=1 Tax=Streptacidiphilus jiangxiensis TaxID=235985 RepID=A0A1H7SUN0_STRJI|nr:glycosyltransferase family 39 protein [Streptacidiphilus jiangxiensis]SEL75227.1 4-amino-4-deoxy-L-arabinose transferase [Streptacidiphilus jiangxiensis]
MNPTAVRAALRDRAPLLAVLALQIALAYLLTNTAFEDEALYLYAGHRELDFLLHHTPTYDTYSSYFSGAPFLYPVLAALVDSALGLEGARALSLLFMVGATALVWMTARRLYGRRSAAVAAALFGVSAPTLFMSRLATYDAMCVFLLAAALWLVVRTARANPAWALMAAPVLVLAAATKYASALYLPTVVAVALLVVPAAGGTWRRACVRGVLLAAATAALAWVALVAWPSLRQGLEQTTVNRAAGAEPLSNILRLSAVWGGWIAVLAVVGVGFAARTQSRRVPATLLAGALTVTAAFATLYQAHLGTSVSLHKHIGFGLLFAAPVAGLGLASAARLGASRARALPGFALGVCVLLAFYANHAVAPMYGGWPDSSGEVAALRPLVGLGTDQRYLVEENEIPRYYLAARTEPFQWLTTYYFQYKSLTGLPAYQAAIRDGYFNLVVLDYGPTAALDRQLKAALKADPAGYRLLASVPGKTSHGTQTYDIWQRV